MHLHIWLTLLAGVSAKGYFEVNLTCTKRIDLRITTDDSEFFIPLSANTKRQIDLYPSVDSGRYFVNLEIIADGTSKMKNFTYPLRTNSVGYAHYYTFRTMKLETRGKFICSKEYKGQHCEELKDGMTTPATTTTSTSTTPAPKPTRHPVWGVFETMDNASLAIVFFIAMMVTLAVIALCTVCFFVARKFYHRIRINRMVRNARSYNVEYIPKRIR